MSRRSFAVTAALAAFTFSVATPPTAGQALSPAAKPAKEAKSWTPPHTPDGHDLRHPDPKTSASHLSKS